MLRGTKNLTRQQIQDALDKNFARLGGGGGRMRLAAAAGSAGLCRYSIQTKRANLPAVLEILRQVLREPTLPESEFEVMKNERLAGLEQGRSDPMRQAINHLQRLLSHYPPDDVRYVPTIDEEIQRTQGRRPIDQVRSLYRDLPGRQPRRAGDRRRLRALRGPLGPEPDVRGLEEPRSPTRESSGRSSPT